MDGKRVGKVLLGAVLVKMKDEGKRFGVLLKKRFNEVSQEKKRAQK